MYGVAEATVFSTAFDVTEVPTGSGPVPLGQPLASAAVRIVDAEGRPLPDFVAGEIELHGPSIAQGYVVLPELTAARFGTAVDCAALSRWYRTGDVGHWDGQRLHYHGRRDGMVKLRGHRVELAEVEGRCSRSTASRNAPPRWQECVVGLRGGGDRPNRPRRRST